MNLCCQGGEQQPGRPPQGGLLALRRRFTDVSNAVNRDLLPHDFEDRWRPYVRIARESGWKIERMGTSSSGGAQHVRWISPGGVTIVTPRTNHSLNYCWPKLKRMGLEDPYAPDRRIEKPFIEAVVDNTPEPVAPTAPVELPEGMPSVNNVLAGKPFTQEIPPQAPLESTEEAKEEPVMPKVGKVMFRGVPEAVAAAMAKAEGTVTTDWILDKLQKQFPGLEKSNLYPHVSSAVRQGWVQSVGRGLFKGTGKTAGLSGKLAAPAFESPEDELNAIVDRGLQVFTDLQAWAAKAKKRGSKLSKVQELMKALAGEGEE